MKAAETKAAATPAKKNNSPFFHKGSAQDFFGNTQKEQPFFSRSKNNNSFIQPKLTIGQPNDVYEKEAETTADKVVQRLNENKVQAKPEKNNFFSSNKNDNVVQQKPVAPIPSIIPPVQTKCTTCEEEEKLQKKEEMDEKDLLTDKLQKKPVFESNAEAPPDDDSLSFGEGKGEALQRKCDECDKEDKLQKKEKEDDKDLLKGNLQRKPIFESNAEPTDDEKSIQRKCTECEQEDKVQKKSDSSPQTASPNIESSLNSSKGSGSPLPHNTREQMESSFGADFSKVRIHNDSSAEQMNKDLHAQAFTHGSDIYFNSGKYDSNSNSGKHLLAHELTHVVQQNNNTKKIQQMGDLSLVPSDLPCEIASSSEPLSTGETILFGNRVTTLTADQIVLLDNLVYNWNVSGKSDEIRIDGYASRPGSEELNWRLSCSRAKAVANELIAPSDGSEGIPGSFIQVFAQGETDEFGAIPQNRRVTIDIKFTPLVPIIRNQPSQQNHACELKYDSNYGPSSSNCSFYNSDSAENWFTSTYRHNASCACENTPDNAKNNCVRKCLQEKGKALLSSLSGGAVIGTCIDPFGALDVLCPEPFCDNIYQHHVECYKECCCNDPFISEPIFYTMCESPFPCSFVGEMIERFNSCE
ncbi:MAG TPA: DUF4157 domain-containing protein [Bacteroidia bacterium]|nr:DUF4157 domain-containing protein [Bacteroidia bacterium]